jgi:sugar (pentulose or hexulose) kinase
VVGVNGCLVLPWGADMGSPQDVSTPRAVVVRSTLGSVVAGATAALDELRAVTDVPREEILHIGGASRIPLFDELLTERSGLPVRVGSSEATAFGNALVRGSPRARSPTSIPPAAGRAAVRLLRSCTASE